MPLRFSFASSQTEIPLTLANFLRAWHEGSILGRVLFFAAISARTTPQWVAPTFEVIAPDNPVAPAKPAQRAVKPVRKNKFASLWCPVCVDYVEQVHTCPIKPVAENVWLKTATALHTARTMKQTRRSASRIPNFERAKLDHAVMLAESVPVTFHDVMPTSLYPFDLAIEQRSTKQARNVVAEKKPRCKHENLLSFTFSTGETITLCSGCGQGRNHQVLLTQKFAAPEPFTDNYITWRHRELPMAPVDAWYAEQCELELKRLGMTVYEGIQRGLVSYKGSPQNLELIAAARERDNLIGGKHVNTAGVSAKHDGARDDSSVKSGTAKFTAEWEYDRGDCCSRDHRANQVIASAAKHVAKTIGTCLYCGKELEGRKGTKYCLGTDHRQRHWEQQNSLKETA